MDDLQKAYSQAIKLSQELKVHLDTQPSLQQAVKIADTLASDLGWLWVKHKDQ